MSADPAATSVVASEQLPQPFGVWSPAVLAENTGRTLYVSGLTSRDADNNVVAAGDMEGQTRQICKNLQALVEAAGGTLEDFVSVTVFAVDVTKFDEIHRARKEFFPTNPPASTMVEISRLVDERCLIEINAIAVLPGEDTVRAA
jgi:enamine deaminase RidA (YjgF/YER057c/UK114 family)